MLISEWFAVKFSNFVITDNVELSNYVSKRYEVKTTVITYGGDHVSNIPLELVDDVKIFEKYSFLREKYAFMVCRIEPENNLDMILECYKEFKDYPLVLVGNWESSEYGKKLKNVYEKYDHMYLYDAIYDQKILDILRSNAYVYIHGHSVGGTNPSLVEAMSLQLSILAFDVSYNRITTGNKALYFSDSDELLSLFRNTEDDTYKAKFIIIAEGSQGKLKYQIRRKDRKDEYAIGIVAEIEADNESIDKYIHNAIDFQFGRFKQGYGWIFPHENYFSVGIGGLAKHLPHPKKTMLDFLNENNFNNKYKLHSHIIPAGGIKRKITSSRVVLSGDSAGFVDSFLGEGIAYAIRSGQIAVEVISKIILNNNDMETIKNYEIICKSEFIDNLNYSLILTKLISSYPSLFLKIFTSNKAIEKYLEVPTMETSYKNYIKWLIPRIPMFLLRS